jgi:hypothetical protein
VHAHTAPEDRRTYRRAEEHEAGHSAREEQEMATQVASRRVLERQATRRADARQRLARERRTMADTLETTLQPRCVPGSGPRVPHDNRDAAATPVREIILLLRNPAASISREALRRIAALTTHPASPLYGQYSAQARYAAFAIAADLRTSAPARVDIGAA